MQTITIIADPFSSLPLPAGERIIVAPHARNAMWEIAADVDRNSAAQIARQLIDPFDARYDERCASILTDFIKNLIETRGQEWSWPDIAMLAKLKPQEIERFYEAKFPGSEYFLYSKDVYQTLPHSLTSVTRLAKLWKPGGARRLFSFRQHFRARSEVPVILRGAPSEWIKAAGVACALAIREAKGVAPLQINLAFDEMPALYRVPELQTLQLTARALGVRFGGISGPGEFVEDRRAA